MAETDPDQAEVDVDFPDFDSFDFDELLGRVLPFSELIGDVSGEICAPETRKEEEIQSKTPPMSPAKSNDTGRKRKTTKVEWTPEMHRRFVQAVEQLGPPDKAMPSKILELMGVHHLTRHNVANHLQKYRLYRKRLAAREAAAATRKRQLCDGVVAAPPNHPRCVPVDGFPPPTPLPVHPFRPLRVWGHSTHQRHATTSILNALAMSKLHRGNASPTFNTLDLYPGKESVEDAIDDALSKPWQPFPIGLKPPPIDNVIGELQCHGVSAISPYYV